LPFALGDGPLDCGVGLAPGGAEARVFVGQGKEHLPGGVEVAGRQRFQSRRGVEGADAAGAVERVSRHTGVGCIMAFSVDGLLDRLIVSVEKKRVALDETLKALHILKAHSSLSSTEEVRKITRAGSDAVLAPVPATSSRGVLGPPKPDVEDDESEDDVSEDAASETAAADAKTHFAKVLQYFLTMGNLPYTTAQIRAVTRLSRSALSVVLYKTHQAAFVKNQNHSYKTSNLWSLRPELYEDLRAGRPIGVPGFDQWCPS
jgi:hypothetical protein